MTDNQKRASAIVSFAALLAAVVAVSWLAYLAFNSSFLIDENADEPKLRMSWVAVIWFIKSAAMVKVLYGGLLGIIAVGTGILGELYKRTGAILALAGLCLAGVAACNTIMIQMSDPENLKTLRFYSDYPELAQLQSGVDTLFGSAIGWFVSCLGTHLGIRIGARSEVAKRMFARWRPPHNG